MVNVAGLRVEYRANPLGVEAVRPRLGWIVASDDRGAAQAGYRALVASSEAGLSKDVGDLWDSGRVTSDQSVGVEYGGKALGSRTRCFWKVRVWDSKGEPSAWSAVGRWEMGLLAAEDWRAAWIAADVPGPLFRRSFTIARPFVAARAYVCGVGCHELYVNGRKVGDHVLDPAQTDYEQRAFYVVHDVTELLRQGGNAAGVMLGNGWFNQDQVWGGMSYGWPRVICQIEVTYADDRTDTFSTDGSWKCAAGPVVRDNLYAGETYDARREIAGWCEAGFDDSGWQGAKVVESPTRRLVHQSMPAIKWVRTLEPVRITQPKPGAYVVDLGQNFAGFGRLTVREAAGTHVKMRYAEAVGPDGQVDTASTGVFATNCEQVDTFVCKGGGDETWEPRFTYHGFRYVEVTGVTRELSAGDVRGVVVHTAVERAGEFACSDDDVNRLHKMALWTQVSNLHGVPTDCPAREKCGWLGDAHVTAEMTMLNFDMATFWPKYVGDIVTTYRGDLPGDVAPGKRCSGPGGNTDWGAALVMIPWWQYVYYGDERILRERYEVMAKFVRNVHAIAKDGIVEKGYGDWCPPGDVYPITACPPGLTTTAWFCRCCEVMGRVAEIVGKGEDGKRYRAWRQAAHEALLGKFYDRGKGSFGSQAGDAVALAFGLVPAGDAQRVADDLARDVMDLHHGHASTGIFGSRWLYAALAEHGHADVARTLMHQTTYPSVGHLIGRGATTFWECWGEKELDQKHGARSLNHPMQGALDAWFYQGILGIRPREDGPGFAKFDVRSDYLDQLEWAKGSYASVRGRIVSEWRHTPEALRWDVTVPGNTQARLFLPVPKGVDGVRESGRPVRSAVGVTIVDNGSGPSGVTESPRACLTLLLAPGAYSFVSMKI
jgi:alpha-L-rhamnosidase